MSDYLKLIRQSLNAILHSLQPDGVGDKPLNFTLDYPTYEKFGDLSSNLAMVLYPKVADRYSSPLNLAQALAQALSQDPSLKPLIERVEAAPPGFINFYFKADFLLSQLNLVNQNEHYGQSEQLKNEKIVVEYTDPNPFKEFHIGHVYSNTVGEAIARLKESQGASVYRADYFGDVGIHVAKAVWAILEEIRQKPNLLQELAQQSIPERQKFLGHCYSWGSLAYDQDPEIKKTIDILNTHLYPVSQQLHQQASSWKPLINYQPFVQEPSKYDPALLLEIYRLGRQWSLDYFETIYQRLGTRFDGYYPESKTAEVGYQLVKDNLQNGIFETSQDAIVFKGETHGLHTRVFINRLGLPTYEAKELGLAPAKYADFPYTQSIIVTGNEVNDYFKVLIAVLKLINPELGEKTLHLGHGMVRLPEGKMSSRTGNVITGDHLIDEAKNQALAIISQLNPNLEDKEAIADIIGIGAIKYAFLKAEIGSDVIFSFKDALSFNGNSGPYLQYTHARCQSVLAKTENVTSSQKQFSAVPLVLEPQELSLLKTFLRFPDIINQAALTPAPHLLCTYLYDLGQKYNAFYNSLSILGSKEQPLEAQTIDFRLSLTQMTAKILSTGLHLLGIKAPNRM